MFAQKIMKFILSGSLAMMFFLIIYIANYSINI